MKVENSGKLYFQRIDGDEDPSTVEEPTGSGSGSGRSIDLDGVSENSDNDDTGFQYIFRSLSLMIQSSSQDQVQTALVEVMEKVGEILAENEEDKIRVSQEELRTSLDAKLEMIEKADKKLRKAMRKDNGSGTWGKIKIAFSFATAIATMAVAGALIAGTSGGCPAGYAMMASGALQFVMASDMLCTELTGHGLAGNYALLTGKSNKEANYTDMAFRIQLTIAIIACSICSGLAAVGTGANGAALSAGLLQARALTTIASSILTLSTATGDSYFSVRKFEAADLNRDSMHLRADSIETDAVSTELQAFIDACLEYLKDHQEMTNKFFASVTEVQTDISRSLSHMKT